jgi:hypothetical protein
MRIRQPSELESVRQARRSISAIRLRLLKPTVESLDACAPHLHNAVESVHRLQHRLGGRESQSPGSRGTLPKELSELRRALSQVTALMRNAAGFYGALVRLLSPRDDDSTGYDPSGAVSPRARPTLQFEG